jgi:hypothetical protein
MKKTHNTRYLLAALLLLSLSAFFFVNSRTGFLSELSLGSTAREIALSDREKSEDQQESARIPGLFTLARLLELAGHLVNRGL